MNQALIDRINELSRLSKERELTAEEQVERQALRQEYLQVFRANVKSHLLNIKVVDETGADITPDKLKLAKAQQQN
ncbi:MAG: DUF896 domain-containing protein [Culicoidibacterales bacterium]